MDKTLKDVTGNEVRAMFDQSLLDDLDKTGRANHRRPAGYGILVEEYATEKQTSIGAARDFLNRQVRAGKLASHKMIITGRVGTALVFHRVDDWPPAP